MSEQKIFNEFILSISDEIIENDEECNKLNQEIIQLENELKQTMTADQIEKFIKYLNLVLSFNCRCEKLIFLYRFKNFLAPNLPPIIEK